MPADKPTPSTIPNLAKHQLRAWAEENGSERLKRAVAEEHRDWPTASAIELIEREYAPFRAMRRITAHHEHIPTVEGYEALDAATQLKTAGAWRLSAGPSIWKAKTDLYEYYTEFTVPAGTECVMASVELLRQQVFLVLPVSDAHALLTALSRHGEVTPSARAEVATMLADARARQDYAQGIVDRLDADSDQS